MFNPNTVIVGKNNAGKSTVVEALLLLSAVVNRPGLSFSPAPVWLDLPRFTRCVCPSVADLGLNLKTVFHRYGDPPAKITARFEGGAIITLFLGKEKTLYATIHKERGSWITTRYQLSQLNLPGLFVLPQVGPLQPEELLLTSKYVRSSVGTRLSPLHFRNQVYLFDQSFDQFKRLAESTWHGLRILRLEETQTDEGTLLSLLVQDGDFVAEVGWTGHGLQMWLQVIWFLANTGSENCIVLDEPDVYMHPDLQRKLFRLASSRFRQVIIATHSVEIMAEVEPSNILIVDRTKRRSEYANSEPALQYLIDQIGGIHNIHLARLWSARRFILIEGKDLSVLRHFHSLLFPDSETPLDSIPNLSIGGWGGWSYAIGSSMVIYNAMGEHVITYCILDSDYHTNDEIQERAAQAEEHRVELHVWGRKEIENYLLNPGTIRRIIVSRIGHARNAPSVAEIENEILKIAEELKESVIDGIAERYLSKDRRLGITAHKRARQKISRLWADKGMRLSIVPGKEVLKRLTEWSTKRFNVSFGPPAIARQFRLNEIPEEMVNVLRAIEECRPFDPLASRPVEEE